MIWYDMWYSDMICVLFSIWIWVSHKSWLMTLTIFDTINRTIFLVTVWVVSRGSRYIMFGFFVLNHLLNCPVQCVYLPVYLPVNTSIRESQCHTYVAEADFDHRKIKDLEKHRLWCPQTISISISIEVSHERFIHPSASCNEAKVVATASLRGGSKVVEFFQVSNFCLLWSKKPSLEIKDSKHAAWTQALGFRWLWNQLKRTVPFWIRFLQKKHLLWLESANATSERPSSFEKNDFPWATESRAFGWGVDVFGFEDDDELAAVDETNEDVASWLTTSSCRNLIWSNFSWSFLPALSSFASASESGAPSSRLPESDDEESELSAELESLEEEFSVSHLFRFCSDFCFALCKFCWLGFFVFLRTTFFFWTFIPNGSLTWGFFVVIFVEVSNVNASPCWPNWMLAEDKL